MVENHQELRNWLAELHSHDPTDARGILKALAAVIALIAAQLEPGPPGRTPSATSDTPDHHALQCRRGGRVGAVGAERRRH